MPSVSSVKQFVAISKSRSKGHFDYAEWSKKLEQSDKNSTLTSLLFRSDDRSDAARCVPTSIHKLNDFQTLQVRKFEKSFCAFHPSPIGTHSYGAYFTYNTSSGVHTPACILSPLRGFIFI